VLGTKSYSLLQLQRLFLLLLHSSLRNIRWHSTHQSDCRYSWLWPMMILCSPWRLSW